MRSPLKVISFLCLFASTLTHSQSQLVIDTDEFHYTAAFDPSQISERSLRELLVFSPYALDDSIAQVDNQQIIVGFQETPEKLEKGPIAYSLENCIDSDPRYRPCGTRDILAPNFFVNAQVNVEKNEQVLAALNRLKVPMELSIVLQQFRDSMVFYSAVERLRLEYLQTGDLRILSRPVANLHPLEICHKEIGDLKQAATLQRRYELSKQGWHNCLNSEWMKVSPPYPREAWTSFLRAYGIVERYTPKAID
jgi:hypothetical protein